MNWITAHWQDILTIVTTTVVLAGLVVELTPTPRDDATFAKVYKFLKVLGLKIR